MPSFATDAECVDCPYREEFVWPGFGFKVLHCILAKCENVKRLERLKDKKKG
jgi:hypothetical protein